MSKHKFTIFIFWQEASSGTALSLQILLVNNLVSSYIVFGRSCMQSSLHVRHYDIEMKIKVNIFVKNFVLGLLDLGNVLMFFVLSMCVNIKWVQ